MGPSPSAELTREERESLLDVARRAVRHGALTGRVLAVGLDKVGEGLRRERGCFVTLRLEGQLRGCVGSLAPRGALVAEVARAAFNAAFRDPRFSPVAAEDVDALDVHISVLSAATPVAVASEAELLAALRPGVDGLTLREGTRMGTFLPDVWKSFPEPAEFVRQLKLKAGLAADHWSKDVQIERYEAESFG